MDVKTLYTLVAVADRGSFAEAGKVIGLSLSAVSMQMRALEEELGTVLFDRTRRPPVLTASGLRLIDRARDLIEHWESLSDSLKRDAAGGVLKLGAVHTSISGWLPLALRRLQQRGQGIEIRLTSGLTHELEMEVYHGQLDVALVTEPEVSRGSLQFHEFFEEAMVVIAHKSATGDTDQELLEHNPYVRFNRMARVGRIVGAEIEKRGLEVQSTMEIDSVEGVVAMVANGLGVSVVPNRGVANEFPATIRVLPFGDPPIMRRLGLLMPRDNPRSHLSHALLDALREVSAPPEKKYAKAG
ncbi:LysR family transcriptional regulator [Candidimonas nitroreducens]|uniref:LysR family transcriptional regulator n=1 Tax=Candidimonas nitroreducens TaxID=683354 RepID=A0A225MFT5_9BURK|nr:LysR family transcriptional regulator [Candidimonas nitroreducens]OWT60216.1 LysR family transcriptional regulator [Candidimonas nitroreducens]